MDTKKEFNLIDAVREAIKHLGEKGLVPDLHVFIQQKAAEHLSEDVASDLVDCLILGMMHAGVVEDKHGLYALTELGKRLFEQKQDHPYAEMLEARADKCDQLHHALIKAAGSKSPPAAVEHDPARAKALIEKVLGEYAGHAYMKTYDKYHPVFGIDALGADFFGLVFYQDKEMLEADLFLAGPYLVNSLESLADAFIGCFITLRLKNE